MAIDIGDVRIGIAVSDTLLIAANPLQTLVRKNIDKDIDTIIELAIMHECETIIYGLPRTLRGEIGDQGEKIEEFARKLAKRFTGKVIPWDERLSTLEAQRALIEGSMRRNKRKKVIDQAAAVLILQNYLSWLKEQGISLS